MRQKKENNQFVTSIEILYKDHKILYIIDNSNQLIDDLVHLMNDYFHQHISMMNK